MLSPDRFMGNSPVKASSEMFYAAAIIEKGAKLSVLSRIRRARRLSGRRRNRNCIRKRHLSFRTIAHFETEHGNSINRRFKLRPHFVLGGTPLEEKRYIWWNFVSSSAKRIEQAKSDWKAGHFASVPDETGKIPLPADSRPVVARYP